MLHTVIDSEKSSVGGTLPAEQVKHMKASFWFKWPIAEQTTVEHIAHLREDKFLATVLATGNGDADRFARHLSQRINDSEPCCHGG